MASGPGTRRTGPPAENDIYTVLTIIAFVAALLATIYLGYRAQTLFGTLLPPGGS